MERGRYIAFFLLALCIHLAYSPESASFNYSPSSLSTSYSPPPANFTPLHNFTCVRLARAIRGAVNYTDFESYPLPGWAASGGNWSLVATGFRGSALRGVDNNLGLGGTSLYYWNTSLTANLSFWVTARVRAENATDGYKGIGLFNTTVTGLYKVTVVGGSLVVRRLRGTTWSNLTSVAIPGYSATAWYSIVVSYSDRATAVVLTTWVFNATGHQVAFANVSDTTTSRFRVQFAGVVVDGAGAHFFEDFMVSTRDPRFIVFNHTVPGMAVELRDNLGNRVNRTGATTFANMTVTGDMVVGTGVNGVAEFFYPDNTTCLVFNFPTLDAVLGGDVYNLTTANATLALGANATSASVSLSISNTTSGTTHVRFLGVNATANLTARLVLTSYNGTLLYADIYLEALNTSTPITIVADTVSANATSYVPLNATNRIYLTGFHSSTPPLPSALSLLLEVCRVPGEICAQYPVNLTIR